MGIIFGKSAKNENLNVKIEVLIFVILAKKAKKCQIVKALEPVRILNDPSFRQNIF